MSNKKKMEKPLRKYILKGAALLSVILVNMILQVLIQAGRLIKMAVNGTGNLEFYQVVVDGKATDMVLAVVDGKAKLIPAVAVNSIKDRNFTYSKGNFVTGYQGKMVCIEKFVMSSVTGQTVNQLMQLDVHHMWFRFCALPETLKMISRADHVAGHQIVGGYARNQVIYIDSVDGWDEFINIVMFYRSVLKNRYFSIEL